MHFKAEVWLKPKSCNFKIFFEKNPNFFFQTTLNLANIMQNHITLEVIPLLVVELEVSKLPMH